MRGYTGREASLHRRDGREEGLRPRLSQGDDRVRLRRFAGEQQPRERGLPRAAQAGPQDQGTTLYSQPHGNAGEQGTYTEPHSGGPRPRPLEGGDPGGYRDNPARGRRRRLSGGLRSLAGGHRRRRDRADRRSPRERLRVTVNTRGRGAG